MKGETMKRKTCLRSAARKIGMDAGNLSKLAEKWGVSIADEAALMALGREHQRPDHTDNDGDEDGLVPFSIVKREIHKLCEGYERRYRKHHKEGAKLMRKLAMESLAFADGILAIGAALESVLESSWHGPDGLFLPAEKVAAIQDCFPKDHKAALAKLRERHDGPPLRVFGL
jgi:hypothetical protein